MMDLPSQLPTIIQTPYIDKRELRALLHQTSAPPSPRAPIPELTARALSEAEKDQLFKQRV